MPPHCLRGWLGTTKTPHLSATVFLVTKITSSTRLKAHPQSVPRDQRWFLMSHQGCLTNWFSCCPVCPVNKDPQMIPKTICFRESVPKSAGIWVKYYLFVCQNQLIIDFPNPISWYLGDFSLPNCTLQGTPGQFKANAHGQGAYLS